MNMYYNDLDKYLSTPITFMLLENRGCDLFSLFFNLLIIIIDKDISDFITYE